jgi:hypothetical protein
VTLAVSMGWIMLGGRPENAENELYLLVTIDECIVPLVSAAENLPRKVRAGPPHPALRAALSPKWARAVVLSFMLRGVAKRHEPCSELRNAGCLAPPRSALITSAPKSADARSIRRRWFEMINDQHIHRVSCRSEI